MGFGFPFSLFRLGLDDPFDGRQLFVELSWRSTVNGLESQAASRSGTLAPLDESRSANFSAKRLAGKIVIFQCLRFLWFFVNVDSGESHLMTPYRGGRSDCRSPRAVHKQKQVNDRPAKADGFLERETDDATKS